VRTRSFTGGCGGCGRRLEWPREVQQSVARVGREPRFELREAALHGKLRNASMGLTAAASVANEQHAAQECNKQAVQVGG
jgi:hypothetical protein